MSFKSVSRARKIIQVAKTTHILFNLEKHTCNSCQLKFNFQESLLDKYADEDESWLVIDMIKG